MAENLYLEVTDACMHACATCPHGAQDPHRRVYFTPVDEVIRVVDEAMKHKNVRSITISGGEPLLHPNIVEIVARLTQMGLHITMLTNLQVLCARGLGKELARVAPGLSVVTALHSVDAAVHDGITSHLGSHAAALAGVDELVRLHIDVTIKIILSMRTCRELQAIQLLILERWGLGVRINLCGLDLCGVKAADIARHPVDLRAEGQMIETYLDGAEKVYQERMPRFISLTEYPLCWIDPYFWKLVHRGSSRMTAFIQEDHMDTADTLCKESTCDCHAEKCRSCVAARICPGLWWSVYRAYGEECVRPYLPQQG